MNFLRIKKDGERMTLHEILVFLDNAIMFLLTILFSWMIIWLVGCLFVLNFLESIISEEKLEHLFKIFSKYISLTAAITFTICYYIFH